MRRLVCRWKFVAYHQTCEKQIFALVWNKFAKLRNLFCLVFQLSNMSFYWGLISFLVAALVSQIASCLLIYLQHLSEAKFLLVWLLKKHCQMLFQCKEVAKYPVTCKKLRSITVWRRQTTIHASTFFIFGHLGGLHVIALYIRAPTSA